MLKGTWGEHSRVTFQPAGHCEAKALEASGYVTPDKQPPPHLLQVKTRGLDNQILQIEDQK